MSLCRYNPFEITSHEPRFNSSVKKCFYVPERSFGKSNGRGLVTTGAGPCLVVVVHDTTFNQGCLAHLTETLTDGGTFLYSVGVIENMIHSLIGDDVGERIQIFLLQGRGRFRGFNTFLNNEGYFGRCQIHNHIDNGFANYLYLPLNGEIYPAIRTVADSFVTNEPISQYRFDKTRNSKPLVDEFTANFHDAWAEKVNTGQ